MSLAKPQGRLGGTIELVVIVVMALLLALGIQAWIVKPYRIPSGSMEPTLDIGQRVLANRFIYHFTDPAIGDIIVFHPPADRECGVAQQRNEPCPEATPEEADENFIKRIVAGPGDTLSIREGHPVVNGVEKVDEPYINPCESCNFPRTITIPPDHYFVMGDNRGGSFDSRYWGPIPRDWIIGKAFATYWPLDRVGLL